MGDERHMASVLTRATWAGEAHAVQRTSDAAIGEVMTRRRIRESSASGPRSSGAVI